MYSNLDRSVYVDPKSNELLSLEVDSAYRGPIRWREDVIVSRLPIGSFDPEIGHLDASPSSAILGAIDGFKIEVTEDGKYRNLIATPGDDIEFSYLRLLAEAALDAFVVEGFINGFSQVDVVLDTTASTPLVCHGPIGPLSVSSLRLKTVEFPMRGLCDGTEENSGIFTAMRFASQSMITIERPTVVINPSVLKGTVIHFDGKNRRVGFKPLDL